MNVGPAAHLSGQMSGQAAQMNQVAGSGVGVGAADGLQQHQPMQDVGAFSAADQQFVLLRTNMRQRIYEYLGRKQTAADWQKRLPELAKRLEEILYRKFPNRNDYYSMMKGPVEPQLQFAIKTLSAQSQQNQQNAQMSRQIASSSGYGTTIPTPGPTIPTPGMTQGTSVNSRNPYVTDNNALSSSGAGLVPQNSNMGTSMPVEQEKSKLIDTESKQLWTSVEQIKNKFKAEEPCSHDDSDQPQDRVFDTSKPVCLSKLMQDRSSRYMNYVRLDIQNFQSIMTERPLDKKKLITEIDGNLTTWADWFKPPPLEMKRLMDGFNALREALTTDPQSLVASYSSKRDKLYQRVDIAQSSQDTVAAACASMIQMTKSFEEQVATHDSEMQHHLTYAQTLRAQIQDLNAKLRQAEDAHGQEERLKEQALGYLAHHKDRCKEAMAFQSELETISVRDRHRLQDLEQKITDFTNQDDAGLSGHVCSLLDFLTTSFKS